MTAPGGAAFRILGTLELGGAQGSAALAGDKPRTLLAFLLLHGNEVVLRDRLVDVLWPEWPPETAVASLHVHVSKVRRALAAVPGGAERLSTEPHGYMLRLEPSELDATRFQTLTARARRARAQGDTERARELLGEALALWRGPALADVEATFAQNERSRLDDARLTALEDRVELDVRLGRADLGELARLVDEEPLRDRLRAQLMLALYRSGRQNDALEVYTEARHRLREERGLEPSPMLRRLQRSILQHDPALEPASAPPSKESGGAAARVRGRRLARTASITLALAVGAAALMLTRALRGASTAGAQPARPDSVAVLDPATGSLEADVPTEAAPVQLASGAGAVWVIGRDRTLTRIDAGGLATRTFGLPATPAYVAAGAGGVWLALGRAGSVARLGPDERLTQTIRLGREISSEGRAVARVATGIVATAGNVWVVDGSNPSGITRIDSRELRPHRLASYFPAAAANALTGDGERLWSLDGNVLTGFDTRTGQITEVAIGAETTANGFGGAHLRGAVAASRGLVWAAEPYNRVVEAVRATSHSVVASVVVGGTPTALAAGDSVWVGTLEGRLYRIDPALARVVSSTPIGGRVTSIVLEGGRVWVAVGPRTA